MSNNVITNTRTNCTLGFGMRQPSHIQLLKSILEQYPDDGQILKELIQNAEDAGATKVKFLLDKSTYPLNQGQSTYPSQFQGPALYAYNDATFAEDDWNGIGAMYESLKKDDPIKVGRFGLGFKSVFHMTDLPGILSGHTIAFLDPHEKFFPDAYDRSASRSGVSWNLRDAMKDKSGFYHPLTDPRLASVFGSVVSKGGFYNGTLFRFPLRTCHCNSELSADVYPTGKVERIFEQFQEFAYMSLLFLSSLESIELYVRESLKVDPGLVLNVQLSPACVEKVRSERKQFRESIDTKNWMVEPVHMTQQVTIKTLCVGHRRRVSPLVKKSSFGMSNDEDWLIANFFAGGSDLPKLQQLCGEKNQQYLPWVSVAMSLNVGDERDQPQGHIFCFLPLPVEKKSQTGLPVHVNGFFAVDQNRRHLKWPSEDQNGFELTDRSLKWNYTMLIEAVPLAFKELIIGALQQNVRQDLIYNAIPNLDVVDCRWAATADKFLKHLEEVPFLLTLQGRRVRVREALFSFLSEEDYPSVINRLMVTAGEPVVIIPGHIRHTLSRFIPIDGIVTPPKVRNALEKSLFFTPENAPHCFKILQYVIQDGRFDKMRGLKLVPLADGRFTGFQDSASEKIFLLNDPHLLKLFPGLEGRFVIRTGNTNDIFDKIIKSGQTNLVSFKKENLAELISQVIPSSWKAEEIVPWKPGANTHITSAWIELVWDYINKKFPYDLSSVQSLHIFPVRLHQGPHKVSQYIKRVSSSTPVIVIDEETRSQFKGQNSFYSNILQTLAEMGIFVVENLSKNAPKHQSFRKHVNTFSVSGVLNALSSFGCDTCADNMKEIDPCMIGHLRSYLAQGDSYTIRKHANLLKALPIFNSTHNNRTKCYAFDEIDIVAPVTQFPFKLPKLMLSVADDKDSQHLCNLLSVSPLSLTQLVSDHIFPSLSSYTRDETDELAKFILTQMRPFHGTFTAHIKEAPIFLRTDGNLARIGCLFDPSDDKLVDIFEGQLVFLSGSCSTEELIPQLRKFGLKTANSVTPDDIIEAVQRVSHLNYETGKRKAQALMHFLSQNPHHLVNNSNVKQTLPKVAWISVKPRPNYHPASLLWYGSSNRFEKPSALHDPKHEHLIGCVRPVANFSYCNGIEYRKIALNDVSQNLILVAGALRAECHADGEKLRKITLSIYRYLNLQIRSEKIQVRMFSQLIREAMRGQNCILIGESSSFVKAEHVSLNESDNLPPFRYTLPHEIKEEFGSLMKAFGVVERFGEEDYCAVLLEMKNESKGRPLTKDMLDVTVKVSTLLSECLKGSKLTREVYLPSNRDKGMYLSSELCFNDCNWIKDSEMPFVYNHIPYIVAHALGVKSKRSKKENDLSIAAPFGQSEKITNRIKRILTGYSSEVDVLKEMLQNADDAHATEIHFCLDTRQHSIDKLFEESWVPLQGPALCVYNNGSFTEEDFEGIQNLGEGSKESDPSTTGRYGVGFNVVYHITDAPSFLTTVHGSGERLCVFDPNRHFVPSATNDKPGGCYASHKVRQEFPSVTECYDTILSQIDSFYEEGILCDNPHEGTLFRFPLRDVTSAKKSAIKDKPTTVEEIQRMMESFQKEASSCLLFLNNIKRIFLYEIGGDNNVCDFYHVHANIDKESQLKLDRFQNITTSNNGNGSVLTSSCHVAYEVTIRDSNFPCLNERWLVAQVFDGNLQSQMSSMLKRSFQKEFALLPRGGVACKIETTKRRTKHSVFCTLPLPQRTSFPVHINGQFLLDHEARRNVWMTDDRDIKSEWNRLLMRTAIAQAYVRLLCEYKELLTKGNDLSNIRLAYLKSYIDLFPLTEPNCMFNHVVRGVYDVLSTKNTPALPVIREVPEQGLTLDQSYPVSWLPISDDGEQGPLFRKKAEHFHATLLKCGLNLLWEDTWPLGTEFKKSGINAEWLTPESVLMFFRTLSPTETSFQSVYEVVDILLYCKKAEKFVELLEGTPLLITEANVIEEFSEKNQKYLSRYLSLVDQQHKGKFVCKLLVDEVFKSHTFSKAAIFKEMTVVDLSGMLSPLLKGPSEIVWDEREFTLTWIVHLWSFLQQEWEKHDHLQPVSLLRSLNTFCLIPAYRVTGPTSRITQKQHLLVQLKRSKSVVIEEKDETKQDIVNALKALNVPFLRDHPVFRMSNLVINSSVSSPSRPVDILTAVEFRLENAIQPCLLSEVQSNNLLHYFTSLQIDEVTVRRIKHLPLFLTISGCFVGIERKEAFILPDDIPAMGLNTLTAHNSTVFLKDQPELHACFGKLKIVKIQPGQLYRSYIFPHLHQMSDREIYDHMTYINDKILPTNWSLIKDMKHLKFLPSTYGMRLKASDFFDWKEPIFHEMLEEIHFPLKMFREDCWHPLLVELGLQQQASRDQLVQFAMTIAGLDSSCDYDIKRHKSSVLLEYLMKKHSKLSIPPQIKRWPFILKKTIPEELTELCPRYSTDLFVSFDGSVVGNQNNTVLVWSSANLLPGWLCFSEEMARILGVYRQPSLSSVIKHCSHLCTSLQRKLTTEWGAEWNEGTILNVMRNIFRFLISKNISFSETEELSRIPLVLISETRQFAYARQLVDDIREIDQIKPYLFKIPSELAEFKQLFFRLGAHKDLNAKLLLAVLRDIKNRVGNDQMVPEEIESARKAYICFLQCTEAQIKQASFSEFYLPTRSHQMMIAHGCVFVDDIRIYEDVKDHLVQPMIIDIENEPFQVFQTLKLVPEANRPKILSEVVHEKIEQSGEELDHTMSNNKLVTGLQERLSSDCFGDLLARLVYHVKSSESEPPQNIFDFVQKRFNSTEVFEVEEINSYYVNDSGSVICESTTGSDTIITHERSSFTVFISSDAEPQDVYNALAKKIDDRFDRIFGRDLIHLISLINIDKSFESLPPLFDKSKICRIPTGSRRIELGSDVPESQHHYLEQDFSRLQVGDLVGYNIVTADDQEPRYITARIHNVLDGDSTSFGYYVIDIGGNIVVASALDLYKMSRPFTGNAVEEKPEYDIVTMKRDLQTKVKEAWKLQDVEREKVLCRLLEYWYPERNVDNEEMCRDIYQYLKQLIKDLEHDTNVVVLSADHEQRIESRVRAFRRRRMGSNYQGGNNSYSIPRRPIPPNPQPAMARTWYRQATEDFEASSNDVPPGKKQSYMWACYKCHQSSEKALKALQIAVDANLKSRTHNLPFIASKLTHAGASKLVSLASELQGLVGDASRMRYPDNYHLDIPADSYTMQHVELASNITKRILEIAAGVLSTFQAGEN